MRLIDADLLKQNCKITGEFNNHFQGVDLVTLGEVIDNQPTINVKNQIVTELKNPTNYTIMVGKHFTTVDRVIEIVNKYLS